MLRRLSIVTVLSGTLSFAFCAVPSIASAQEAACSFSTGTTTCESTSVSLTWSETIGFVSGTTNDGSLTALFCQPQYPNATLIYYDARNVKYHVETTTVVTDSYAGKSQRKVSSTSTSTQRVLGVTNGDGGGTGIVSCNFRL